MLFAIPLMVLLGACASGSGDADPVAEAPPVSEPVGNVALSRGSRGDPVLDLAVQVFDRGLDAGGGSVFPELRKAESILLPVKLAATLAESGYWGAVRVAEAADVAVPVRVYGRILRADGAVLELAINARAADGGVLLDRLYRDEALESDYGASASGDPFADIYRAISNDLGQIVRAMDSTRREQLDRLALMAFATRLAPETFGDYIVTGSGGKRSLTKFPASDDPMLARLERLRNQDYLFIDTVDQQYRDLAERIGESYDLWRQYSFELALYGASYRSQVGDRPRAGRRGSFAALQQVYGTFRKVKLQEEDLQDLVAGFAGESLETVMEVDDGVVSLRGSVSERYAEWRRILARIYTLESGGVDAE